VGYAGRVLRSLGATVVKVESASDLDPVRVYGASCGEHGDISCCYLHLNGSKCRAVLDRSSDGPGALAALLGAADLGIIGRGALADSLEAAIERDPARQASFVRIVPCVTPPTGIVVPADEAAGAATGLRDLYSLETPPEGLRLDIAEINAGAHAAATAGLALARRALGHAEPTRIDVGIYESTFSMIEIAAQTLLLAQRFQADYPDIISSPLAQSYYCSDGGAVVINIYGHGVWERTCAAIGRPDLLHDPRFGETFTRYQHSDALYELLRDFCASLPRDEAIGRLWAQRIPSAPVLEPAELRSNAQLVARGVFPGDGRRVASCYVIDGQRDPLEPMESAGMAAAFDALAGDTFTASYAEEDHALRIALR
jgi:formyl-CoA transferase